MATRRKQAATLEEKLGFVDEDLKTPAHDALIVWIDQHAEELAREFFELPPRWPDKEIEKLRLEADEIAWRRFYGCSWSGLGKPPKPDLTVASKVWERPIITGSGFTVGFADLAVTVECAKRLVWSCPTESTSIGEAPITWDVEYAKELLVFEAKTKIASAGELIRQIRMYEQHLRGHYIVVSPDDRFASVLRGQRIHFIKHQADLEP